MTIMMNYQGPAEYTSMQQPVLLNQTHAIAGRGRQSNVPKKVPFIFDCSGKAGLLHIPGEKNKNRIQLQLEKARQEARENERNELGRELHDNVNQLLVAARMFIELAKKNHDNQLELLNSSSAFLIEAVEEIRKITYGLVTPAVETKGLSEAITALCEKLSLASQVTFTYTNIGFTDAEHSTALKLNIFRIIQEQFNNILKYAGASKVDVTITANSAGITLVVSDNGIGFDQEQKSKGIGLANIQSRAKLLNGTAVFDTQKNKGCRLIVAIP